MAELLGRAVLIVPPASGDLRISVSKRAVDAVGRATRLRSRTFRRCATLLSGVARRPFRRHSLREGKPATQMIDFASRRLGLWPSRGRIVAGGLEVGFAEDLVDQVGAAWSVPAITRDERAAYVRLFEAVGIDTSEMVVRGFILGTRPTRPSPDEIATAASGRRVQADGDAGVQGIAAPTALTRVAYYRGGDPEHPPIRQPGYLALSDGLTFVLGRPPKKIGGRFSETRTPTPDAAFAYPEVLSIVDAQVVGILEALGKFEQEPGFAAAAREIGMCLSHHDGLDADELCTAVIARSHGRLRVPLFEWELETNPETLEAFSSARAAWRENCEHRLARSTGDDGAEAAGRFFHEVVARRRTGIDYAAMHPLFAEADYLGGDPLHRPRANAGTLVARDAGLSYRHKDGTELLHLRPREIRCIALRRPDALRRAVRAGQAAAIGGLLGGQEGTLWDALVGSTWKSQRWALLVIAERDQFRFTAGFALAETSGQRLLEQSQVQRLHLGMPALSTPEDLVHRDGLTPQGRRAAEGQPSRPTPGGESSASPVGEVIQMPDPLDQIERLGSFRDRGLITDDEFEAKKRELLDRM
jgi:hypothetical protein